MKAKFQFEFLGTKWVGSICRGSTKFSRARSDGSPVLRCKPAIEERLARLREKGISIDAEIPSAVTALVKGQTVHAVILFCQVPDIEKFRGYMQIAILSEEEGAEATFTLKAASVATPHTGIGVPYYDTNSYYNFRVYR